MMMEVYYRCNMQYVWTLVLLFTVSLPLCTSSPVSDVVPWCRLPFLPQDALALRHVTLLSVPPHGSSSGIRFVDDAVELVLLHFDGVEVVCDVARALLLWVVLLHL